MVTRIFFTEFENGFLKGRVHKKKGFENRIGYMPFACWPDTLSCLTVMAANGRASSCETALEVL